MTYEKKDPVAHKSVGIPEENSLRLVASPFPAAMGRHSNPKYTLERVKISVYSQFAH
jgi:hypothetical protein